MVEIKDHPDAASFMADPDSLTACLDLLRALQSLEVNVVVNGRLIRCPIRFSAEGATVDIPLSTP